MKTKTTLEFPIGSLVYPIDNSFAKELDSNKETTDAQLAGQWNQSAKHVMVISEPYKEEVSFMGRKDTLEFINVSYEGKRYRMLMMKKDIIIIKKVLLEYLL